MALDENRARVMRAAGAASAAAPYVRRIMKDDELRDDLRTLIVAIILLTIHFRRDERWRGYVSASSSLAVLGAGSSIFMGATGGGDLSGLSQRLMVVPLLLWVVLTALRLRSLPRAPASER